MDLRFSEDLEKNKKKQNNKIHSSISFNESDNDCSLTEEDEDNNINDSNNNENFDDDDINNDEDLTLDDINVILEKLDLDFVSTSIMKEIPKQHQEKVLEVLKEHIKHNHLNMFENMFLPKRILDYKYLDLEENQTIYKNNNNKKQKNPVNEYIIHNNKSNNNIDKSINLNMKEFSLLCEAILAFVAFIKYGNDLLHELDEGVDEFVYAVSLMKHLLVNGTNRGENTNNWNLQKCLEISHFLQDMIQFGSASGFSTQTGERGLKFWAKIFAITAQKRSNTIFTGQVIQRMQESELLYKMSKNQQQQPISESTTSKKLNSYQTKNKQFKIIVTKNDVKTLRKLSSGLGVHPIQHQYDSVILQWFHHRYKNHISENEILEIQLYTDMILINNNNETQTLRSHPCYNNNKGCHDFCWTKYETNNTFETYPSKIACYFEDPLNNNKISALVQDVQYQSEKELNSESILFKHYTLSNKYNNISQRFEAIFSVIEIETITDTLFAIQNAIEITPFSSNSVENFNIITTKFMKDEWPIEFLNLESYLKITEKKYK